MLYGVSWKIHSQAATCPAFSKRFPTNRSTPTTLHPDSATCTATMPPPATSFFFLSSSVKQKKEENQEVRARLRAATPNGLCKLRTGIYTSCWAPPDVDLSATCLVLCDSLWTHHVKNLPYYYINLHPKDKHR